MGFYFRKSFGAGPFRINLSKSGLSYSFGVKGARVNFSNRGTYVNFGSNGIYYRKKISGFRQHTTADSSYTITPLPAPTEEHTITSGNLEEITDIDSQDFIDELTQKGLKISYYKWFGVFPWIIAVIGLSFLFFKRPEAEKKIVQVNETKNFVSSIVSKNVNIRSEPNKTGTVLGVMKANQQYPLLDSTISDWYKIKWGDRSGYVSKKLTSNLQITTSHEEYQTLLNENLFEKNKNLFWTCIAVLSIFFVILLIVLKGIDKRRKSIEIYYEIDEKIDEVYQKFIAHFSELLTCSRVWQYLTDKPTNDYKYSSGAAHTITRKPLTNIYPNKAPSKIFKTNVQVPFLGLINTELYFFPERIIIKRGSQYGAIMYKHVECNGSTTRFIEDEGVPRDSEIVDHTWRYLNKDRTPDRRFSNNYQIPICRYSEYSFQSASGLNERIAISKVGAFDNFIKYIGAIGQLQQHIEAGATKQDNIEAGEAS